MWKKRFPIAFPISGSISLIIQSFEPETIKDLLWCQAILVTSFPCPSIKWTYLRVFMSHILIVLSSEQLAIFVSLNELHSPLTPSELEFKMDFSFNSFANVSSLIFIRPFLSQETIRLAESSLIMSKIILSCSLKEAKS